MTASSAPLADLDRDPGEQHFLGCRIDFTRRGMAQGRTVSGGWRCDGGAAQNIRGDFCAALDRRSGGERHLVFEPADQAGSDHVKSFKTFGGSTFLSRRLHVVQESTKGLET